MKSFYVLSKIVLFTCIFLNITAAHDCACKEDRSNKLFDQDFGMALTPDDFLTTMMMPWMTRSYFRPWRPLAALAKDIGSTIKTEKDKFQINLDVQHFTPEEITVKTADGYVVVEAKHEEKEDEHGFISRQFVRKYSLPEGAESNDVVSELSSDGVLTITAPRKILDDKSERLVPITKTGPVRKEPKEKNDDQGTCEASGQCDKF